MTIRFTTAASTAALLTTALLAGCGSMSMGKASAVAALAPTAAISPNPTMGRVTFTALDHGVRVAGEVRGFAPGSEHGFHIHEKGDCSDNAMASGGHFNPTGGTHGKFGAPGSHAGELPSLVADANGVARFSVDDHSISLTEGAANSVLGRALVVHKDPDDFKTQPAGNSGPRTACAVITKG
ncbi:superoxide dismutase family protein [Variovorax sp. RT4R15]|uniref:superoxide dismutase family protein n=1 Tax=Variovorax sp. RT4R15 TaxID=3443737 RepID=UPI003F4536F9